MSLHDARCCCWQALFSSFLLVRYVGTRDNIQGDWSEYTCTGLISLETKCQCNLRSGVKRNLQNDLVSQPKSLSLTNQRDTFGHSQASIISAMLSCLQNEVTSASLPFLLLAVTNSLANRSRLTWLQTKDLLVWNAKPNPNQNYQTKPSKSAPIGQWVCFKPIGEKVLGFRNQAAAKEFLLTPDL